MRHRGTSGIDGIVSTSIGQAQKTTKIVVCLVGDVSFFYDSNALFFGELPQNLRIVMMNNGGGNIFRIIDGPSKQEELESHFVTHQTRTAESLAKESGIRYLKATTMIEMAEGLDIITKGDSRAALLEVFTDGQADAEIFKALKAGFIFIKETPCVGFSRTHSVVTCCSLFILSVDVCRLNRQFNTKLVSIYFLWSKVCVTPLIIHISLTNIPFDLSK